MCLIATYESAAFGFIEVLELVAFTALETNNELVLANLTSARAIEDRPIAPGALGPPGFLQRAALGHVETVQGLARPEQTSDKVVTETLRGAGHVK